MTNRSRIAVIGAGLAGLTAAWRLRQSGFDVVVLEAEPRPGGRSLSTCEAGCVQDHGAWTFTAQGPVTRLVSELGLERELVTIAATVGRPVDGLLRVGDLGKPLSLPGTVFHSREMLPALKMMWMARTMAERDTDETVAAWAARHFSSAYGRDVLEPLAGLYFLQDLSTLSRNTFLGTVRYLSKITLHSFRSGMGFLTSWLAARLPVRYEAAVENVQLERGGIRINGPGMSERADGLVVATPLPETARLLKPYLSEDALKAASEWQYAPALVVRLLLKGRWPRTALQVLPPRGAEWLSCGFTMERAKSAERVPEGYEIIAMYARADRAASLARKSDEELADLFAFELHRWLPPPKSCVEKYWVDRWRHAAAHSDTEVPRRLAVLEKGFEDLARVAPVWAAGDFRGISGLSGAVQSAERAARMCSNYFSAPADLNRNKQN